MIKVKQSVAEAWPAAAVCVLAGLCLLSLNVPLCRLLTCYGQVEILLLLPVNIP